MKKILRYVTPLEISVAINVSVAYLLHFIFHVQFYLPSDKQIIFRVANITIFIVVAFVASQLLKIRQKISLPDAIKTLVQTVRVVAAFSIAFMIYFNFKIWGHLIRPELYDETLHYCDLKLSTLMDIFKATGKFLCIGDWQYGYDQLYGYLWLLGIFLAYVKGPDYLQRVATMICFVWLIGGLCYIAFPSYGPMVFAGMNETQLGFFRFTESVRQSHGNISNGSDFTVILGAMPSLHIADSVAITYYLLRMEYWVFAGLAVATSFIIIIQAVTLHWHYILDIPVGMLVAAMGIWLTEKLVRLWLDQNPQTRIENSGS